jgi:anti-anti-sigma factor
MGWITNMMQSAVRMTVLHTDRCVVRVAGELDVSSYPQLRLIAEVLACQEGAIDFDLGGVTFIDSSGWAAVQEAARTARGRIVNPSPRVRQLTDLMARTRTPGRRLPNAA